MATRYMNLTIMAKGFKDRWRGAMAQDLLRRDPMAVGHNYLTVDYSKIDVNKLV